MTYILPVIHGSSSYKTLQERRYEDRRGERKRKVGEGEVEKQEGRSADGGGEENRIRRTRAVREEGETETFTPV